MKKSILAMVTILTFVSVSRSATYTCAANSLGGTLTIVEDSTGSILMTPVSPNITPVTKSTVPAAQIAKAFPDSAPYLFKASGVNESDVSYLVTYNFVISGMVMVSLVEFFDANDTNLGQAVTQNGLPFSCGK